MRMEAEGYRGVRMNASHWAFETCRQREFVFVREKKQERVFSPF
jgi:hypothetical protein